MGPVLFTIRTKERFLLIVFSVVKEFLVEMIILAFSVVASILSVLLCAFYLMQASVRKRTTELGFLCAHGVLWEEDPSGEQLCHQPNQNHKVVKPN